MEFQETIAIHRRLISDGLAGESEEALVDSFCRGLCGAGLPIMRFFVGSNILHPLHDGRTIVWEKGRSQGIGYFAETEDDQEAWLRSPIHHLMESGEEHLHRRLDDTCHGSGEFPVLDEFREKGGTGYLAVLVPFRAEATLGGYPGIALSYLTDRKGGFTDADIGTLRELSHTFALTFRMLSEVFTGRTLLRTYLGADAADRVLAGRIRRGQAEVVQAVLWSSDLRGFTRIADTAPQDELLPFLDAYAECQVEAIEKHGGQVLKFIGDGILAMFDAGASQSACNAALDAVAEVRAGILELGLTRRREGRPATDLCIGLHVGEVLYGNIGSPQRLDFTVIGPAVNEVSRIEAMCRALDQPIVVSSAFRAADADAAKRLVSLGRYALRGVARPRELFTVDPER